MKKLYSLGILALLTLTNASAEVVYVESPTDTDRDGKPDRIYVQISRPNSEQKLPTIFKISPYSLGGNETNFHTTDVELLPQDERTYGLQASDESSASLTHKSTPQTLLFDKLQYAQIKADSLGTGRSTGCPTVGDMSETLAAKAVIDWLNGRARAFTENGVEVRADWANGSVGMIGTSYDGTLPIMVASTGVEGLKAIIPVGAISSWYDYYRANGLVVNPDGYMGEDADILGKYIVRKNACKSEIDLLTQTMGRENGDFTPFWQARDYVSKAKSFKAATFIIHGQSDWNVKQKNATQLWEALEGIVPLKMYLHRGGHEMPSSNQTAAKVNAWFDYHLQGIDSPLIHGPRVEVELKDGSLISQNTWPSEKTQTQTFYFKSDLELSQKTADSHSVTIVDSGKTTKLEKLDGAGKILFMSSPLPSATLLSGSPRVQLNLAVLNRRAANITVAILEYDTFGRGTIITRGWADPQNYRDPKKGELLNPGQSHELSFSLEPKQFKFKQGNKIGVLITATDYNYTFRPEAGTEIRFEFDQKSFIELKLGLP